MSMGCFDEGNFSGAHSMHHLGRCKANEQEYKSSEDDQDGNNTSVHTIYGFMKWQMMVGVNYNGNYAA